MNNDQEMLTMINHRLRGLRRSMWINVGVFVLNVGTLVFNVVVGPWWFLALLNALGAFTAVMLVWLLHRAYVKMLFEKQLYLYASNKLSGAMGMN